jgi:hypothetical protein
MHRRESSQIRRGCLRYLAIGVALGILAIIVALLWLPSLIQTGASTTIITADVNTLVVNSAGVCGQWRLKPSPSAGFLKEDVNITSVDALSGKDLWMVGEVYGPRDWDDNQSRDFVAVHVGNSTSQAYSIQAPLGHSFPTVRMISSTDVWASGPDTSPDSAPQLAHWDGDEWKPVPIELPASVAALLPTSSTFFDLAALPGGEVWVAGTIYPPSGSSNSKQQRLVMRRSAGGWQQIPTPDVEGIGRLLAIDTHDVWIDGVDSMLHWNGQQLTKGTTPQGPLRIRDMGASAGDDVWAVGHETGEHEGSSKIVIMHWNGQAWSRVPVPTIPTPANFKSAFRFELTGVAAVSTEDAWAVGYLLGEATDFYRQKTITLHWDGRVWSLIPGPNFSGSQSFSDIVAVSPQELWAVGQVGPDIDEKNILLTQFTRSACSGSDSR